MLKKLKSNKGYVFTYEAVIIAFIFMGIFYLGYTTYNYNILASLEEKKDTEKFHKILLLKDLFLKKYDFPGSYNEDYIENFTNKIKLNEKIFDPCNNFTEELNGFYFITLPNEYDETLDEVASGNNNFNLNRIEFNFSNEEYFSVYSNVVTDFTLPNSSGGYSTLVYFNENLYIPKITGVTKNTTEVKVYGCNGDHIYFEVDKKIINASARIISNNEELSFNVTFTVNGQIYKKELNSTSKDIGITPNLKKGINEIRILSLNTTYPVEFTIETNDSANFYYLTLSPRNVTILVGS
ncbi:hypothetical protein [Methanocaldococcus fervens]|uniref:Uncharacterized protein n=1 Tax=Methanocaldococcus fervens (strain DSM 4213 / JCM 15782 / AG86) TaxID=573064 RepID=C7P8Z9_METFA|nr:hypothetical protein [Methanocaldococcus fervens]ACV25031.1 conserved hypothetical protein [Methanocaldococcus fervens AG86]